MEKRKSNWYIVGMDAMYGGLHGMWAHDWLFDSTEQEAEAYGHELSASVIESYSCIMETIEDEYDPEAAFDMDIEYCYYELKEGITEEDLRNADKGMWDWKQIVSEYCKN